VINTYGHHQSVIEKGVLIFPENSGDKKIKEVSNG